MAYDEKLAQRVRALMADRKDYSEKKMLGGIALLLDGRMCCGVLRDELVARISVDEYQAALGKAHVRPMDFTGRPMKGYIYVGPQAIRSTRRLRAWLDRSIAFVATLPPKKKPKKRRI
jgi:TfoX/Sxy family transcriptional regulator of competence genes